jgi:tetratricopeptide (TPR) repeat protein
MVMLGATLLSVYVSRGDLAYGQQFAAKLTERAEESGSVLARGAAYWNAGTTAYLYGDLKEALRLEGRAVAFLGEGDDHRNLARLNLEYGRLLLCAQPGAAEQARDLMVRAREQIEGSAAGAIDLAMCDAEVARAELALDRPDEAVRLATTAVERLNGAAPLEAANALIMIGYGMRRNGHRSEAATALRKAVAQLSTLDANRRAAQSWFEVAELMSELEEFSPRAMTDAYLHALACVGL